MDEEELHDALASLERMLALAKRNPQAVQEQIPQFQDVMQPLLTWMIQIYHTLYQWYVSIGAPRGASHEAFNIWLEEMATLEV